MRALLEILSVEEIQRELRGAVRNDLAYSRIVTELVGCRYKQYKPSDKSDKQIYVYRLRINSGGAVLGENQTRSPKNHLSFLPSRC